MSRREFLVLVHMGLFRDFLGRETPNPNVHLISF